MTVKLYKCKNWARKISKHGTVTGAISQGNRANATQNAPLSSVHWVTLPGRKAGVRRDYDLQKIL